MRRFCYRLLLVVSFAAGSGSASHDLCAQDEFEQANKQEKAGRSRLTEPDPGSGLHGRWGPGHGMGRGMQHGRGHAVDDRHKSDREVFQYLLLHHQQITRQVKELPDGVETVTESEVEEIADQLKEHVVWMEDRVKNTRPIRMRDPLFAELFRHADKIKMVHEETVNGVKVIETSDDPHVARLIKEHAKTVSGFVQHGFAEAAKNHRVPAESSGKDMGLLFPAVASYGGVIRLPEAAMQPRMGTKVLVDLTRSNDPAERNGGVRKGRQVLEPLRGCRENTSRS